MVVGKKERSDIKLDNTATLILNGQRFPDQTVYSDTEAPKRRDVFPPDVDGRLPQSVAVEWQGKRYRGMLDFRTGSAGQSIPVYSWDVESRAQKD